MGSTLVNTKPCSQGKIVNVVNKIGLFFLTSPPQEHTVPCPYQFWCVGLFSGDNVWESSRDRTVFDEVHERPSVGGFF